MPNIQSLPTVCEKCGQNGHWDNRDEKRNPKAPDFKCKNKQCGNGVWLAKGAVWVDRPVVGVSNAAPKPQPASIGNLPDWPAEQEAQERQFAQSVQQQDSRAHDALDDLFLVWDRCLDHVRTTGKAKLAEAGVAATDQGVFAATATLFIAAKGIPGAALRKAA